MFFHKILGMFSNDLAIDLGTANTKERASSAMSLPLSSLEKITRNLLQSG
jgi:hypothetical protein